VFSTGALFLQATRRSGPDSRTPLFYPKFSMQSTFRIAFVVDYTTAWEYESQRHLVEMLSAQAVSAAQAL